MKRGDRGKGIEPGAGMPPRATGATFRTHVEWVGAERAYLFQAGEVEYRLPVGAPGEAQDCLRLEGRVGEGEWIPLLTEAGMLYRSADGPLLSRAETRTRCQAAEPRHSLRGRSVVLEYEERAEETSLLRRISVQLLGGTLELRVEAPGGAPGETYCGFSLGEVGPGEEATQAVVVPGLPDPLWVVADGFLSAYPDRFLGQASAYPPGVAVYGLNQEGVSRPMADVFYVTLSTDPLGPLPTLVRGPAPRRAALESRVTLDLYSEEPYAEDARLVKTLACYGLTDVTLLVRNWQQFGFDRRVPLLYPAAPERGNAEAFRAFLAAAHDAGWLVALREEYAAIDENSPYWNEKVIARWEEGSPRQLRPGRQAIAADRMLEFARLEATKIQRNYRTDATFVDGHTAWNPEGAFQQVDAALNSGAGTEARAIQQVEGLLAFLREIHEGPVLGEGGAGPEAFDTLSAGIAEGVLRGPEAGVHSPLLVDYELCEVSRNLVGIGAGDYARFIGEAGPVDAASFPWDDYRATAIALGHAGYLGNFGLRPGPRGAACPAGSLANASREYFLLRGLQELYLGSPVLSVVYFVEGEPLSLAQALFRGADLTSVRLQVEYASGLTVWVNRAREGDWIVAVEGESYVLPPAGFVAASPKHRFLAYTARRGGERTDFCRASQYVFADTRGSGPRTVEGMVLDGGAVLLRGEMANHPDVVLIQARQLLLGEEEYRLSERGDARFVHLSSREMEMTLLATESDKPATITWPATNAGWRGNRFEVLENEGDGWHPSRLQVVSNRGVPTLPRARVGVTYRVSFPGGPPTTPRPMSGPGSR